VLGDDLRRGTAEFIGAFGLTFFGVGAIMVGSGGLLGVALAHGLAIALMVTAFGHISGGHFNPAVTFGFLVARRIEPPLAGLYWLAQLLGALVAAIGLRLVYDEATRERALLGTPALGRSTTNLAGVGVEAILTFLLVFVVFAVAVDRRGAFPIVAGLPIGFVIVMDILMGGPLTGAAMNPARWFGPALVQGHWDDAWVWIVGPLLGGAAGGLAYDVLLLRGTEGEPAEA
jgi:aquaporin TIP